MTGTDLQQYEEDLLKADSILAGRSNRMIAG